MSNIVESIQIHLNSNNSSYYVNGQISNCVWNLSNSLECPNQTTIYVSVKHANIPYSFYNIDDTNNRLDYTVNGQTVFLSIDNGNYNAYQLASYFTNNMTHFTVTYDSITNKFTFRNSLYDFVFAETSTCLSFLGFNPITLYLTSILKSLTSNYCANLQTKQCICIASNNWTTNCINSMDVKSKNILCSIPITTQPYSNIVYINNTDFKSNLYTNVISSIQLKLVDQNNNVIDLNGCDWSITLQLDVIELIDSDEN